jgi:hypothetical protein
VFRGGTGEQQERLSAALDEYAAYLGGLGLPTEGQIPEVDLTTAPEGMVSAYDPSTNTILIDPRLADDPQFTLHEYSHMVLARCGYVFEYGGALHLVENALAEYFVCAFAQSPLYLNSSAARLIGFEPDDLSRPLRVADLAEPDDPAAVPGSWRGFSGRLAARVQPTGSTFRRQPPGRRPFSEPALRGGR